MASRVVRPESETLRISNGDWLLVRKRLTAGENKRMVKRGSTQTETGLRIDSIEAGTAKILAYLIDWSLKGPDGDVIPIHLESERAVEAAIDSIDPASYSEILQAIEAHEGRMQAERAEEKKLQAAVTGADPISALPSAAAGVSSGSVN
jgi:hypothetical protein